MIRSRNIDPKGIEGDEGAIMLEDNVTSGRALPFIVDPIEVSQNLNTNLKSPDFYNNQHNKSPLLSQTEFNEIAKSTVSGKIFLSNLCS